MTSMSRVEKQALPAPLIVVWRGVRGLCPSCGKGRLFKSYLKQNDRCGSCDADFSEIRPDDGPAWAVMLVTGAMIIPMAVFLSTHDIMPDWAGMTLLIVLVVGWALLLLPRAKGAFMALLWRLAIEAPPAASRD